MKEFSVLIPSRLTLFSSILKTGFTRHLSMQGTKIKTEQSPKLLHVQTNTYVDLPPNLSIIHIGKLNKHIPPDIDVSLLPNSNFVSRVHATIRVEKGNYSLEDLGSANGTYLNQSQLITLIRYPLNPGDRIDLGKGNTLTFIFQLTRKVSIPS